MHEAYLPGENRCMARPLRIEFEGAFYHVMPRGNARQDIFLDEIAEIAGAVY